MKKIEDMSERELLEELVADKRRQQILDLVTIAVVLCAAIFIGVRVQQYMQQINGFINSVNQVMDQVNGYTEVFDSLGEVSQKVNDLTEVIDAESFEQMKEIMKRVNSLLDALHIGG